MAEDNPDLQQFRVEWQRELQSGHTTVPVPAAGPDGADVDEALMLHLEGMALEEAGRLREAIDYYRRAAKLEPDIEFRAHQHMRQHGQQASSGSQAAPAEAAEEALPAQEDLLSVFANSVCEPAAETSRLHISELPVEILVKIFKLTIGYDQDLMPLARLALVCRQWYVAAHDFKIWMYAARLIWGFNDRLESPWLSWKDMCVRRARALFHGVYIGHYTYCRQGEQGLDHYYRPVHLVEYFRYLRFFPDGSAISYTSAERPEVVVPKLKRIQTLSHHSDFLIGTYELSGNEVLVSVRKKAEGCDAGNPGYLQFYMGFQVAPHRQRPSRKLTWKHYVCHLFRKNEMRPVVTEYDVDRNYRPFVFARVLNLSWTTAGEDQLS